MKVQVFFGGVGLVCRMGCLVLSDLEWMKYFVPCFNDTVLLLPTPSSHFLIMLLAILPFPSEQDEGC